MSSLTEEDIKEFQKLYKELYGNEISFEEALKVGEYLVNLFIILLDAKQKRAKIDKHKKLVKNQNKEENIDRAIL